MTKWRDDVNSKVVLPNGEQIPILLLANKCDLAEAVIDADQLNEFVRANGFIGWFATSAQDNVNVDEAMKCLVARILEVGKRVKVERPGIAPSHNSASLSVTNAAPYTSQSPSGRPKQKDDGCC